VNAVATGIFGLSQTEILGVQCEEIMVALKQNLSGPCSATQRALAGEKVLGEEFQITRPDGEHLVVIANYVPLKDETNKIVGAIGSFRDITKRRQAEEELQRSERRFREFLENVRMVAVMLDTSGKIIFANKYLLEITDREASSVLGKN
jgi:PAS domain S-box-containing protein